MLGLLNFLLSVHLVAFSVFVQSNCFICTVMVTDLHLPTLVF